MIMGFNADCDDTVMMGGGRLKGMFVRSVSFIKQGGCLQYVVPTAKKAKNVDKGA